MHVLPMTHEQRFLSSPDDEFWACVVCGNLWPARQMRFQDGVESDRRCPNHYAPRGGTLARDVARAHAAEQAASLVAQHAAPPQFPGWFDDSTLAALTQFSVSPLVLRRGGASVALTIHGTNLASDDTYSYGHAGITNASAPVFTAVTYDSDGNALTPFVDVLVLTVQASVAVPIGLYALTYEDTVYRNVFDVRN